MSNLQVTIWDVNHGVSIYAVAPNGKKVFLDCGNSSDFSPALVVNNTDEKKKLDYLIISHPHKDHIADIENIREKFKIKVLNRNKKINEDEMEKDNPDIFNGSDKKIVEKYFDLSGTFTKDIEWKESPRNPDWGKGCIFHAFYNETPGLEVNDMSVATFIEFGQESILYGGDLKEKGWQELLKRDKFVDHLKKTTILIASHHGNDSGYCAEIFEYFTPKITIFSAGKYRDDDARQKYETKTDGMKVQSKSRGDEDRLVLTTRKDGHIKLVIYPDTKIEPKITID